MLEELKQEPEPRQEEDPEPEQMEELELVLQPESMPKAEGKRAEAEDTSPGDLGRSRDSSRDSKDEDPKVREA